MRGIRGLNKGCSMRIKGEEIRKRLKRLNLVMVIKKYWQMMGCILRVKKLSEMPLRTSVGYMDRNRKSGAKPFLQVMEV